MACKRGEDGDRNVYVVVAAGRGCGLEEVSLWVLPDLFRAYGEFSFGRSGTGVKYLVTKMKAGLHCQIKGRG
jgi:hypothetical protein